MSKSSSENDHEPYRLPPHTLIDLSRSEGKVLLGESTYTSHFGISRAELLSVAGGWP